MQRKYFIIKPRSDRQRVPVGSVSYVDESRWKPYNRFEYASDCIVRNFVPLSTLLSGKLVVMGSSCL